MAMSVEGIRQLVDAALAAGAAVEDDPGAASRAVATLDQLAQQQVLRTGCLSWWRTSWLSELVARAGCRRSFIPTHIGSFWTSRACVQVQGSCVSIPSRGRPRLLLLV